MTLVEILNNALSHAGYSYPQAARRAGIAAVTIEKWMAGTVPRADYLVRFLRACNVGEKVLAKWELPEEGDEP